MKNPKGINSIHKYLERIGHISSSPLEEVVPVDIIIVVPSCGERLEDLYCLRKSLEIQKTEAPFELILVLNNDEKDQKYGQVNLEVFKQIELLNSERFSTIVINKINSKTSKKNGVGLARKIGMDEACARFKQLNKDGIILCLDADCVVSENYIQEVSNHFKEYSDLNAFSLGFEHPLVGLDNQSRLAISSYELHLRYFIEAQRKIGLPFAMQTVGSSMAVRASAYAKEGGMPTLKAGEDFYFLHKFIANNKCGNIPNVLVYPSGRVSDRVPFGTGRAVNEILNNVSLDYTTYRWESFLEINKFLVQVKRSYSENIQFDESHINEMVAEYLHANDFKKSMNSCRKNSTSEESFYKRFFQWFNAFRLMKLLHHLRDNILPNEDLLLTLNKFQKHHNLRNYESIEEALLDFREKDKKLNVRPLLFQGN